MCHSSTRPGTSYHVTQFYQAFPHVSSASDKRWGEKAWVRGYHTHTCTHSRAHSHTHHTHTHTHHTRKHTHTHTHHTHAHTPLRYCAPLSVARMLPSHPCSLPTKPLVLSYSSRLLTTRPHASTSLMWRHEEIILYPCPLVLMSCESLPFPGMFSPSYIAHHSLSPPPSLPPSLPHFFPPSLPPPLPSPPPAPLMKYIQALMDCYAVCIWRQETHPLVGSLSPRTSR